jgi:F-type H+-transporting ATPase subunit b
LDAVKALGINPIYLLSQILNFVILAIALRALLYKPVLNMLEQRRARIEKGLEDARAAETARANAETERQQILDQARSEAQKLRAEASQQAEEAAVKIQAEAKAEADKIRSEAQVAVRDERDRMLGELRGHISALSIAAANKLIGASLDRQRQEALIADFFSQLPADMRSELSGASGPAHVISALPLTPEEQARIKREFNLEQVSFQADPKILGGLCVRVGDKVVDGSVSGQLESLQTSLSS